MTLFNIKVEEMLVNLVSHTVYKKTGFYLIFGDCWFPLQVLCLSFLSGYDKKVIFSFVPPQK